MMAPGEDGAYNCAQHMGKLVILDCPNFSVSALKQLVRAKLNGLAIDLLKVSGRAPVISVEDYLWLSENTDRFNYTRPAVA
jgi:hypothetical protein